MVKIKKILKKNKYQDVESEQEQDEEEQEEYSFKPESEQEHISSEISDNSDPPLLLK